MCTCLLHMWAVLTGLLPFAGPVQLWPDTRQGLSHWDRAVRSNPREKPLVRKRHLAGYPHDPIKLLPARDESFHQPVNASCIGPVRVANARALWEEHHGLPLIQQLVYGAQTIRVRGVQRQHRVPTHQPPISVQQPGPDWMPGIVRIHGEYRPPDANFSQIQRDGGTIEQGCMWSNQY